MSKKKLEKCPICANREKLINELDKLEKKFGPEHRERKRTPVFDSKEGKWLSKGYTDKLDECEKCKGVVCGSTVDSFDFDKEGRPAMSHIHTCPKCKKIYGPFKGGYSDSELRSAKTLAKYGVQHKPPKWSPDGRHIKEEI